MTCGNPLPEALIFPFHVWLSVPCHSGTKLVLEVNSYDLRRGKTYDNKSTLLAGLQG